MKMLYCLGFLVCGLMATDACAQLNPSFDYDTFNVYANNQTSILGDGDLSSEDAQAVIDYLGTGAERNVVLLLGQLPATAAAVRLDVNASLTISALDALNVINGLGTHPFQNPINNLDVNGDGDVTSADVNSVIARLGVRDPNGSFKSRLSLSSAEQAPYYDVNGSNTVSAQDVLIIINSL